MRTANPRGTVRKVLAGTARLPRSPAHRGARPPTSPVRLHEQRRVEQVDGVDVGVEPEHGREPELRRPHRVAAVGAGDGVEEGLSRSRTGGRRRSGARTARPSPIRPGRRAAPRRCCAGRRAPAPSRCTSPPRPDSRRLGLRQQCPHPVQQPHVDGAGLPTGRAATAVPGAGTSTSIGGRVRRMPQHQDRVEGLDPVDPPARAGRRVRRGAAASGRAERVGLGPPPRVDGGPARTPAGARPPASVTSSVCGGRAAPPDDPVQFDGRTPAAPHGGAARRGDGGQCRVDLGRRCDGQRVESGLVPDAPVQHRPDRRPRVLSPG